MVLTQFPRKKEEEICWVGEREKITHFEVEKNPQNHFQKLSQITLYTYARVCVTQNLIFMGNDNLFEKRDLFFVRFSFEKRNDDQEHTDHFASKKNHVYIVEFIAQ